MLKSYRQFIKVCLFLLLTETLGIIGFNFLVDPYRVLPGVNITHFNHGKPQQTKNSRLFKAIDITHIKPRTVLLGSSRTDLGLDANHPLLQSHLPVYNLAILGGNMYEVKVYFDHAISNQPQLKQAIIGLDFFMFNQNRSTQPDFKKERLNQSGMIFSDFLNVTFSVTALTSSIETINFNQSYPNLTPYHTNGNQQEDYFRKFLIPKGSIIQGFGYTLRRFLKDPNLYANYRLSQEQISYLKEIKETCKIKGIDCYFFISPAHATQWEALDLAGNWTTFEQWKREVVKIVPVWDFSGYNSVNSEKMSEKMENFLDSSHYRKKVGNLVLRRVLNGDLESVPVDFGVWVTESNIENHLEKIRGDRQLWVKNNSQEVQFVEKLR